VKYQLITPFRDYVTKEELTELDVREVVYGVDVLSSRRETPTVMETVMVEGKATKVPSKVFQEQGYRLLAKLCGLDYQDILQMDVRDIDALDVLVEGFRGPKVSASSAEK
jgi:DNA integrity scanning protein DisA with diadenylate cyclase activity